jgi:hypothetical protein
LIALVINTHPDDRLQTTDDGNCSRPPSSVVRPPTVMTRKTSLLRIVPAACGQAADMAVLRRSRRPATFVAGRAIAHPARRFAYRRRLASQANPGAILPLHDVR